MSSLTHPHNPRSEANPSRALWILAGLGAGFFVIKTLYCLLWAQLGPEALTLSEAIAITGVAWGYWLLLAPLMGWRLRQLPAHRCRSLPVFLRSMSLEGLGWATLASVIRSALKDPLPWVDWRMALFDFLPLSCLMVLGILLVSYYLPGLLQRPPARSTSSLLAVETGTGRAQVAIDQVAWFHAQGNYVEVHTRQRDYLIRTTMKDLAARLPEGQFVRVHRSYLFNRALPHEVRCLPSGAYQLHLEDGRELPLSRQGRDRLRALA